MTAADGTRLDPRLTAVFDAGATWATEPSDRRGYGDALRDAVERAGADGPDSLPTPTFWPSDPCPVWSIQPYGSARVCCRLDGRIDVVAGSVHGRDGVETFSNALRAALRHGAQRGLDSFTEGPTVDGDQAGGSDPRVDELAELRELVKSWTPGPGAPEWTRTRARRECAQDLTTALDRLDVRRSPAQPAPDSVVLGTLARAAEWSDDPYLADDEKMQVVLDVLREHRMHVVQATPAPAGPQTQGESEAMTILRALVEGEDHWTPERDEAYQNAKHRARALVAEGASDPHGLDPYGTGDGSYPEPDRGGSL